MARNRKKNKQPKPTVTASARLSVPQTTVHSTVADSPPLTADNYPALPEPEEHATVEQDPPPLSFLYYQRTRLSHRATFPCTSTPNTPILTPAPDLTFAFTDEQLNTLKQADSLLSERRTLPAEDAQLTAALEWFTEENLTDYILNFYRGRHHEAETWTEAKSVLLEAKMRPLEAMLEHAQERVHGRRHAAAGIWYRRHAPTITYTPSTDTAVDTFGDFDTLHITTHFTTLTRDMVAVSAGMAALARVYHEHMALWHSPALFTATEQRELIVRRMQQNDMHLNTVFRACARTPVGRSRDDSEAMEMLVHLGRLEAREMEAGDVQRWGDVGRARGMVEYAVAGNARGGDGGGGFTIDEEKAMRAVGLGMGYRGEHGAWIGKRRSSGA